MTVRIVTGADAQANVAAQPCNVMLYGPPGTEKTTDAVRAFVSNGRCNAFMIPCEDGALKPILARGLPVPDHPEQTVKSWGSMQEVIGWLYHHRQNYTAVIVDTVSTWTMYVYKEVEAANSGNKNKFAIPTTMRAYLFSLREWIRALGLHSIFIAHASPPAVHEGVFYRGGPLMAPKTMMDQYFGLLDSVLRVDHVAVPGQLGQPGGQRVYWTGGDQWPFGGLGMPPESRAWLTKNREGCANAIVPADLAAFLRARQPPYAGL